MEILSQNGWMWLCITLGVMLVTILIMHLQSLNFYTKDVVLRRFTIMDLEFPGSPLEVVNIIKGIFLLPAYQLKKTLSSLKGQLYVDFIFMPAAYGSIFLLCMKVAAKLHHFGHVVFAVLAWMQIIAWLCDIIENIYLLNKIDPAVTASAKQAHKAYQLLEITKWGIALTGTVCAVFGLLYFWLTGYYHYNSLSYLVIIAGEIVIFLIIDKFFYKKMIKEIKPE